MKNWNSGKLTEIYEELVHLEQEGKLSVAGQHELAVCEWLLFGKT